MDPVGAFFDEEWDSSNKFFSSEDFELMLHMHGSELFSNQAVNGLMSSELPSNVAAGVYDTVFFTFDHTLDTTNFHYAYQENNNSSTEIDTVSFSNQENVVNFPKDHAMDDILFIQEERDSVKMGKTKSQPSEIGDSVKEMQFKRKSETPEETLEKKFPNKKSRVYTDASSRNKLRIPQAKRNVNQNSSDEIEENQEINGGENGRSCSCYSSEYDFNGGENSESKGSVTGKSNGKARGSRGSATDSQSLYARRRRGRINERLRILQNLVPNGTKVDISTMLEEAVHYVKFLQLQIKLLSSDDTWMYAPIAYNGLMDIGIYENNSPAPRS